MATQRHTLAPNNSHTPEPGSTTPLHPPSSPWMRRNSTSRTPRLEQGGGGGFTSDSKLRSSSQSRARPKGIGAPSGRSLPQRVAILSYKMIKTPRGMAVILLVALTWIVATAVSNGHHTALAPKQVPSSLLPLIRHSGNVIHYISPSTGSRIKSWHDSQLANSPDRPRTKAELEALASHTFHPNGLLLVNPKGPHPIHALIDRAEKKWAEKVERQSQTLQDAVKEYKARYRRNPPKGFDKWWDFAVRNNVQLKDEYDQIHHDLAPHWALEPHDSRHRNRVMQEREHTFTIAMKPGQTHSTVHGQWAHIRRATDLGSLLDFFAHEIPRDLNITFIVDDNPAVMLSYGQRDRMVELAGLGEYMGPSDFVESDDASLSYFAQACAPNSPLRRSERGEFTPDYSGAAQRSFIWDHAKAVDLCQHPEERKLHGHTMLQGVPLGPLVPLFTFAKTRMHADILATPLEQFSDEYEGYQPPWEQKSRNKLLWRGTTTGAQFDKHTPWRLSQRARLHLLTHETEGEREVIWSQRGETVTSNLSVAELNALYMDTSFAGQPEQCDPETCEIMRKQISFKPFMGLEESYQYKYLMDVDGNGWSGRFHRLMSTNALVLKTTAFPEWYQDRVQPWIHYVPIKIDYSDLYDVMAFFVGTPDGHGGHDSIAERIAENGRIWANTHWRRVDMAAYMYRLVLEYSRILSVGEDEVDYVDMSAFDLN